MVVIVSWNTAEMLDACLRSMKTDFVEGLAEVWVVDNGSTDGSVELVRTRHGWVKLLVAEHNLGYGPAINRVAAETSGEWVAASNADIELTSGALRALVDAGRRDPTIGVLGPRLILPDGSTQPAVQPFPSVLTALMENLSLYKLNRAIGERLCLQGYWDAGRPADVEWLTGAFLLVSREAWDEVGGFDEEQWMYAEDIDLCWRLRERGWRVRYEPSAHVRHHLSVAAEKAFGDSERRALRMMRADYRWLRRRRGAKVAWAVALAQITSLAIRGAVSTQLANRSPAWEARAHDATRLLKRHRVGARAILESRPRDAAAA